MNLLEIDDLHVSVQGKEILKGITLSPFPKAKCTPSWARTDRASRPSPMRLPDAKDMKSRADACCIAVRT